MICVLFSTFLPLQNRWKMIETNLLLKGLTLTATLTEAMMISSNFFVWVFFFQKLRLHFCHFQNNFFLHCIESLFFYYFGNFLYGTRYISLKMALFPFPRQLFSHSFCHHLFLFFCDESFDEIFYVCRKDCGCCCYV
jgi:hypothetical protein